MNTITNSGIRMTLIPKISHLLKLPELLKHKQKVEKIGNNDREQSKDREQTKDRWPPFEIQGELPVDPDKISKYKIKKAAKEPRKSQSGDDNVGRNIDLKI